MIGALRNVYVKRDDGLRKVDQCYFKNGDNLLSLGNPETQTVHKIHFLADADVTFVLANGGHNAGVVAAPDEAEHSYQVLTKRAGESYIGPEEWIKLAPSHQGSWWGEWIRFLTAHSGSPVAPPSPEKENSLQDAPGSYVMQH